MTGIGRRAVSSAHQQFPERSQPNSAPQREQLYPPDGDLAGDRGYPLTEAQRRERLRQRREMLDELD